MGCLVSRVGFNGVCVCMVMLVASCACACSG